MQYILGTAENQFESLALSLDSDDDSMSLLSNVSEGPETKSPYPDNNFTNQYCGGGKLNILFSNTYSMSIYKSKDLIVE